MYQSSQKNGHMFIGISIWFAGSVVENIHYKVFKTNEETGDDNIVVNKMLWSHSITKSSYSKELENKIFNVLLEYMDIEYNRLTDLYLLTMQRIREIIGLFNE